MGNKRGAAKEGAKLQWGVREEGMNFFSLHGNGSSVPLVSTNATILANRYSFRLVRRVRAAPRAESLPAPAVDAAPLVEASKETEPIFALGDEKAALIDGDKRNFLKLAGVLGLGVMAASALPEKAQAYVMGSAPTSGVVGVKDAANARISPATEETLQALVEGNSVLKKTVSLSSSGTVHTPGSGKKVRIYNTKFSLDATMTSVSFRFGSGGTDFEKYVAPRTGGLYGTNNHPNYKEGGVDEAVYCVISGTGNVQINIDYLEV